MGVRKAKPVVMVSLSLGKNQQNSGRCRIQLSLHTLVSVIILMVLLEVFSFNLSIMHGTDVIFLGNPIFPPIVSPKIFGVLMFFRFLIKRLRHAGPFRRTRKHKLERYKLTICKQFMVSH